MTTGNPSYDPNESARIVPTSDVGPATVNGEQPAGDTVKQKAGQVADQAQQMVSQATNQAQQQAKSHLATRKDQAAGNLTDVSQAVHQVGDQLRQNDHETLAQYADMAAQQVNRAASYLREHNVNELFDEVQGFARRQPAVFLVGAVALGMLGARFLKSSSSQSSRRSSSPPYRQGAATQFGSYGTPIRDWREAPESMGGSQRDPGTSYGADAPNTGSTNIARHSS